MKVYLGGNTMQISVCLLYVHGIQWAWTHTQNCIYNTSLDTTDSENVVFQIVSGAFRSACLRIK